MTSEVLSKRKPGAPPLKPLLAILPQPPAPMSSRSAPRKAELPGMNELPGKRKSGAPLKVTPPVEMEYLNLLSKGVPAVHAAQACNVTYQTILNHQRRDQVFEEKVHAAISRGIKERVEIIVSACSSQDESVRLRAATWWLSHVPGAAEHFSESRKVEVTGELDGRVLTIIWPHQKQNSETEVLTGE
jgi:hypothetical protein